VTFTPDPESSMDIWDEPILADGQHHARRRCKGLAQKYTEESQSNVELIDVLKASQQTRKRYICRFKSEVKP
jgi:hypothetical protein